MHFIVETPPDFRVVPVYLLPAMQLGAWVALELRGLGEIVSAVEGAK